MCDFLILSSILPMIFSKFKSQILPIDILNQPLFCFEPKYSNGTIPRPHSLIKNEIYSSVELNELT